MQSGIVDWYPKETQMSERKKLQCCHICFLNLPHSKVYIWLKNGKCKFLVVMREISVSGRGGGGKLCLHILISFLAYAFIYF